MAQVDDNLKAAEIVLTPAQMAQLDTASAWEVGYPYEFIARISDGRW